MRLTGALESLKRDACLLSQWFENNYMKMNKEKYRLLIIGEKDKEVSANINGSVRAQKRHLGEPLDKI